MRRHSYTEKLQDLPRVAVPDWQLLEGLEDLLRPYLAPTTTAYRFIDAWDNRSEYDAASVAELRDLVDAKGEAPRMIRFGFSGPKVDRVIVYTGRAESGGELYSPDEATVNHLAARVRDLFASAAERFEPPPAPPAPTPSFWDDHGSRIERWALAIIPGLILLGVGTLIGLWIGSD